MKFIPHKYQKHAIETIVNQPAAGLFLDMGLGKTVCTLTAIDELMYHRFEVQKVLVIAPLRVAESVWPEEVEKWDHLQHLRLSLILGSAKERRAALQKKSDIYVVNRENVPWLTTTLEKKPWPFDMVVVDELSSFKSPSAKRFKALRKARPAVKRIIGLTGTPTPNGLIDLWSQIYLLDQGERLGKTVTGYRDRYFRPGWSNGHIVYKWELKDEAEDRIHEKISDLCISMKSEDWLDMPDRIENRIPVVLDNKDRKLYEQLEKEFLLPFAESDVLADNAAVLSGKLLQLANGAVYDENGDVQHVHDKTLDALEEIIETTGKPVLVFYAYRHDLDRLKAKFPKAREMKKQQDVKDWNSEKVGVMLAHPASAGHGMNLQSGGSTIVWFGMTWSLELYEQANARLYRQGQKDTVVIHHLMAKDTIDEKVYKALINKEAGQKALIEAVKAHIEEVKI